MGGNSYTYPAVGADSTLFSNPYLYQYLMSQNTTFRGNSQVEYADSASSVSAPAIGSNVEGGIPVTQAAPSQASGGSGLGTALTVTGAVVTVLGAGWAIKEGKLGKAGEAIKKMFTGGESTVTRPMKTFKMISKDGSEIIVKDGQFESLAARGETIKITDRDEISIRLGTDVPTYKGKDGKLAENTRLTRYALNERESFDGIKEITLADNKTTISIDKDGNITRLIGEGIDLQTPSSIERYLNSNLALQCLVNKEKAALLGDTKFIIEDGKIKKIITNTAEKIELTSEKDINEFLARNEKIKESLEQKIDAINRNEYNKIGELDKNEIRFTVEDSSRGITYTVDRSKGTQELIVRGELNTGMTRDEQLAWLHQHKDIEKQMNEIIENGKTEGSSLSQFLFKDNNGNEFVVNKKGEIEKIIVYTKKLFGRTEKKEINKGSTEYHSWLQQHKDVEQAIKEQHESGFGTDSTDTVFVIGK